MGANDVIFTMSDSTSKTVDDVALALSPRIEIVPVVASCGTVAVSSVSDEIVGTPASVPLKLTDSESGLLLSDMKPEPSIVTFVPALPWSG
jgi:hypothetical protein